MDWLTQLLGMGQGSFGTGTGDPFGMYPTGEEAPRIPQPPQMPPQPMPSVAGGQPPAPSNVGIPDPTVPLPTPKPMPFVGPMPPPLGQSLEPRAQAPLDIRSQAQMAGAAGGQGGGMGTAADRLVKALQGVKTPAAPDVVKPSTPPPPRLMPIKGGQDLIQMLMALGAPGAQRARANALGLGRQLGGQQ